MPTIGYSQSTAIDLVVPVSQPVGTGPAHQFATSSSVPASSGVSSASAPSSTGKAKFIPSDQVSVASEDDTFQAQSVKESEGELSDTDPQEKN